MRGAAPRTQYRSNSFYQEAKLSNLLPGSSLVDVCLDTARQRMVKSEEEIEIIKLGAAT